MISVDESVSPRMRKKRNKAASKKKLTLTYA